ncbi:MULTISPECIES: 5'-methylthioadenosine/S-adenosylhomocysteine nucleosidase [Sporomusa]|uniref:5'-methylthioadenosine/S-adenosylhomocysteine nucleosidase n=1 Tax=Sporomusa TaxID=2375 RepID=UPI001CB85ABF|nr:MULTISPECIES: 5'-methylthioadenosine/S-adenosylhomocysteine nucleosidase [Sporomusa]MCM0761379.1 5'-methylthioadenosine/S-adenosylhomocysteine nucleosidase [Sporomusa sphaeroides DSM 2875]
MLIGVIGAMEVEIVELTKNVTEVNNTVTSGAAFHRGKLDGYDIVVGKCGVGKVHAAICTQSMLMKYAPDVVINIGIAGSLNPDIKPGDTDFRFSAHYNRYFDTIKNTSVFAKFNDYRMIIN